MACSTLVSNILGFGVERKEDKLNGSNPHQLSSPLLPRPFSNLSVTTRYGTQVS